MKILSSTTALLFFAVVSAFGCDVCGGSVAGSIGLLGQWNTNIGGARYTYAGFHHISDADTGVKDQFHQWDAFARIQLYRRFRVQVAVPYLLRQRSDDEAKTRLNGFGDAQVVLNYAVIDRQSDRWRFFLEGGVGAKLPTGAFDENIRYKGLTRDFNLGTGTWGVAAQVNGLVKLDNWGLSAQIQQVRHAAGYMGYSFGDQTSGAVTVFREYAIADFRQILIPSLQLRWEHTDQNTYNLGLADELTGNSGTFVQAGIRWQNDYLAVQPALALPIREAYGQGEMEAQPRFSMDFLFFF